MAYGPLSLINHPGHRSVRHMRRIGLRIGKIGEYVCCTARTAHGNYFELIPTVEMETRHPVKGSLGSKFPAICNHGVVMAA